MTATGQYPFSTQDGQAVPLEIVKPVSLIFWNIINGSDKTITIPAGYGSVYVFSSIACIFRNIDMAFATFVEATEYTKSIFVPANTVVSMQVESGTGHIFGLGTGRLYMSSIEQWASLSQSLQSSVQ